MAVRRHVLMRIFAVADLAGDLPEAAPGEAGLVLMKSRMALTTVSLIPVPIGQPGIASRCAPAMPAASVLAVWLAGSPSPSRGCRIRVGALMSPRRAQV